MDDFLIQDWTSYIESQVFATVTGAFQYEVINNTLGTEMNSGNFTTEEVNLDEPNFPAVYIHLLPMVEQGNDLENKTINAVMATFQVEVTTNGSKYDANTIMWEVLRIFKDMSFTITSMPETLQASNSICRSVMRARRMIGSGDAL